MSAASVLVVNAGSTSLKLRLLGPQDELVASRDLSAGEPWEAGLEAFLDSSPQPDAAGHRVVHGGTEHSAPALIDAELESRLHELEELAPLHNPAAVRAIRDLRRLRPDLPSVACFDTAFHCDLPAAASTYAVPAAWAERWPLRRFGFHGLSHAYCASRTASLLGRRPSDLRIVSAHLGAGASLAAVAGGRSVDTTMGFTPLDGLVMASRPGSVDPGLLLWVERHGELGPDSVEHALETESGLLGISGRSGDMRELEGAAASGDERAALAIEVYLHRLRASIAAMAAAMEGLDALAFTGGVGEGSTTIRSRACEGLEFLEVIIDPSRNESGEQSDRLLSADDSKPILVVHSREDLEIASQVRSVLRSPR